MTEQEKRDKIIEEMEFVIRPQACNDDICKLYNDNCAKCEATRLYNEGYRKEEEVQKETAKKYSSVITETVIKYLGVTSVWEANRLSLIDSTITYDIVLNTIEKLNEEFSVEVEE